MTDLDLQPIIDVAQQAAEPAELELGHVYSIMVGGSHKLLDLTGDQYRDTPRRKTGTTVVRDGDSFEAYWNRHADEDSEVYADRTKLALTVVLDAHHANIDGAAGGPRWGQHRLVLQLRHSDAFEAWMKWSGQLRAQDAFAEFLEDHRSAIVDPSAADMLELAQSFQASMKAEFRSGTVLKSGERQLAYVEEMAAAAGKRGELTIPDHFTLALAVFDGASQAEEVTARLRYRIEDGRLRIGYVLDQIGDVIAAAFEAVVLDIAERIAVPILRGTPA